MFRNHLKRFSVILTIITLLSACAGNGNKGFDSSVKDIDYKDFRVHKDISPTDIKILDLSSFGIMDFKIADSILLVSVTHSPGLWHLYSLPAVDSIGQILDLGSGPLEVPMPFPCSFASFLRDSKDKTIVSLPINETGKILKFQLDGKKTAVDWKDSTQIVSAPIIPTTIWAYTLSDNLLYQARVIPDSCKITRSLWNMSNDSILPPNRAITILNERRVENMGDIPSILTKPIISPDGKLVAEISGFQNEILIYNPKADNFITVRYPKINIDDDKIREMASRGISFLSTANGYDDFFAVVRNTIKDMTVEDRFIDFISWDGTPLGSLKIDLPNFRAFDIDTNSNTLYLLNRETDQIEFIDITDFVNSLSRD